eukprot:6211003-Pleurochrysis_carterae.AAC.1
MKFMGNVTELQMRKGLRQFKFSRIAARQPSSEHAPADYRSPERVPEHQSCQLAPIVINRQCMTHFPKVYQYLLSFWPSRGDRVRAQLGQSD